MEKAVRELQISAHKNLSLCYLKLQSHRECVEECKKILELEPNCIKILFRVGKAHLELGELDAA